MKTPAQKFPYFKAPAKGQQDKLKASGCLPFAIGLAAFEKISAVEGIVLSPESRSIIQELTASPLSFEAKRDILLKRHLKAV